MIVGTTLTMYVTVCEAVLPAASVAVTVNAFAPAVAVSIAAPLATGAVQVAMPEPAHPEQVPALEATILANDRADRQVSESPIGAADDQE